MSDAGGTTGLLSMGVAHGIFAIGDICTYPGKLKLIFSDKPIELRQWRVEDPQNGPITITLLDIKPNLPLKDNLFEYEEENIFK